MPRKTEMIRKLEELRDDLKRQIETLELKLSGVEMSIAAAKGEDAVRTARKRAPRSNVKTAVLELLEQVKANGLNAAIAVDMAREQRGERLERGSVSSLLSRLKGEGIVSYDGAVYRLMKYTSHDNEPATASASVHPLRASGDKP